MQRQDISLRKHSPLFVTNEEYPSFAAKLQFFFDSLTLIAFKSGEHYTYEVENHVSLINNALFIADTALKRADELEVKYSINQIKYLCNSHPLFSDTDLFLFEEVDKKNKIESFLLEIKNSSAINKAHQLNLETLSNIRTSLSEILKAVEPDYLNIVVDSVIQKLDCQHTLQYHARHLEYLARLVFSTYYFMGYSRKMISDFPRKVFDDEVIREGEAIKTDTYLPAELYQRQIQHNRQGKPFNKELFDEIQEHVNNRGPIGQAEVFKNIQHYEMYERALLFRLDGLVAYTPGEIKELEIMDLKIMSVYDFKKKYEDYEFDLTDGFFENDKFSAIVEIKSKAFSQEDAVYNALNNLKYKLGKVMKYVNGRFVINQRMYSFFPDGIEKVFYTNTMPETAKISDRSFSNMRFWEKHISNSTHGEIFLELEDLLLQGYLEDDITTSIHFYRKFMEVLFKQINDDCGFTNNDVPGIPIELLIIAYLLMFTEKKNYQLETRMWAHNIIQSTSYIPTSANSLVAAYKKKVVATKALPSFNFILEHIVPEQVHTKYVTRRAQGYERRINKNEALNYYLRQLLFLKQYRDKHEHANITDDMIARKLGIYTYRILDKLLRDIFIELNSVSNIGKSHSVILRDMVLSAKADIDG
jgi:hypothetical protein